MAALQAKAAAEETTVAEVPIEETPMEEPPAEEVPTEEAPIDEAPIEEALADEAPIEETPAEGSPVAEAPAADSGELPFDFFGKRDYSGKDGLGVVQDACITTSKAGPAADHAAIATLKAQAEGRVQEPSLMVCPYCGSVVDVGSHFCIICGSALDETGAAMAAAVASQAPVQSADALVEPDFESRLEDESLAAEDVDFGAAPEVRIQPGASEENPLELTAAEIAKKEYTQQVATLAEDFAAKRSTTDFWELDMTKEAAADHKAGVKFTNQYSTQLPDILAAQAEAAAESAAPAVTAPPIFSEDVVFADPEPEPEPERDPLEETMVFSPTDDIMASVRELEKRIMADLDLDIKDLNKK